MNLTSSRACLPSRGHEPKASDAPQTLRPSEPPLDLTLLQPARRVQLRYAGRVGTAREVRLHTLATAVADLLPRAFHPRPVLRAPRAESAVIPKCNELGGAAADHPR